MIYIVAILLFLLAFIEWLHLRALRSHTTVMTVLHGEINDLEATIERAEAKFDGGAVPK